MSTTATDSVKLGRAFAVEFCRIDRWGAASFREVEWSWPKEVLHPMSYGLTSRVDAVPKTAPLAEVPIIEKISFGGQVTLLDKQYRAKYKGRLFWANAGDFVYSKIRAKQGSMAVVPTSIEKVAVSAEYPVFQLRHEVLDPEFLVLVLRSKKFLSMLEGLSYGGSSKTRIGRDFFQELQIPFPLLSTQRAIVAHWQAGMARAAELEVQAQAKVAAAQRGFVEALGIAAGASLAVPKAFALPNDQLERWSIGFIKQAVQGNALARSRYPVQQLADVVADLENGWSPQCHNRPAKPDEWGVLKLGAVSFGTYDGGENKALPTALKPIPAYEIKPGDVLISRANVPRYVGSCAQVLSTRPKLLLCDKIFRVVFKPNGPLDGAYLAEVMKTAPLRQQIEAAITGSSPTMQNITKTALLALRMPIPPVKEQRALVQALVQARAEAVRLEEKAGAERKMVKEEVEGMVMGTNAAIR